MSKDYYSILEVGYYASAEEINRAYRKRALKVHPDRCLPEYKKDGEILFKQLNEAHEILSNPITRSEYNLTYPIEKRKKVNKPPNRTPNKPPNKSSGEKCKSILKFGENRGKPCGRINCSIMHGRGGVARSILFSPFRK